jgi:recombination protein RecA
LNERLKELKKLAEAQFGKGSIMLLGDEEIVPVEVIPTDIPSLDKALGIGGIPRGRIIEIYGPESTGKSTTAMYIAASAQRGGLNVAYIDAEHSLDLNLAKILGINVGELLVNQPDSGEQALEITEFLARTGEIGVIVVDSVAALTPKAEIEGEMGQSNIGLAARLMSQACRKLTAVLAKTGTVVIFINQIRHKIGIMFGSPETTTGGLALKFYSSIRLEVRKGETLKDDERVIGHKMKVKVVKNKLAAPFTTAEFSLIYGQGIDINGDLFDLAVENKIIEKAGSWFKYDGEQIGQGKEQSLTRLLEDNNKLFNSVKEDLTNVQEGT